jgi:hypothetical protein
MAQSFPDTYSLTYFDVSTSAAPSAAGYGGPGFSGGAGDNVARLVNTTQTNGTLCADIYVFDDNEQLQACCGCPVTPDGLRTLSVTNNLTSKFGVSKADLNAGVIKVISSLPNFVPDTSGRLIPLGTNGCSSTVPLGGPKHDPNCDLTGNGSIALGCSPTGLASSDNRSRAIAPTSGLRNWITHDELQEPGNVPGGSAVQGASVEEFQDSPLDTVELNSKSSGNPGLQQACFNLISNGSGVGFCTCGAGDSLISSGRTKSTRRHRHHKH